MSTHLQRTLLGLAMLLALALCYTGARLTLAGGYLNQADAFLNDWAQHQQAPSQQAATVAEHAIAQAVALYPVANGSYHDRQGRILFWQQRYAHATQAYRQASAAWPQWGFSHLNLAEAKLRQGQLDNEFKQALMQGTRLAPWRPIAIKQSVYMGLVAWHTLNQEQQQHIKTAIQHSLQHTRQSRQYTEQLLTRLNRQDLLK